MRFGLIHAEADYFDIASVEFRFQPRAFTKFGGANGSEILWMRKQNGPTVADPLMKTNRAVGCVGCEIWSCVA
jgi:hypothetical protein